MPAMVMQHDEDPRDVRLRELGDISDFEVFNNQVLCVVYVRPNVKTKGGLLLPDSTRAEDQNQGKAGLIVKMGEFAFEPDPRGDQWFGEIGRGAPSEIKLGDWVYYRASDGWAITVNGVLCRILDDTNIRGRVQHPDQVW